MNSAPRPWRFIATEDIDELGVLAGDLVYHQPGRPVRILRQLPCNTGLLLNLLIDEKLIQVEGAIGSNAAVMQVFDTLDDGEPARTPPLKVIR